MSDAWFASAEPELASSLNLTFARRATIVGTGATATWNPNPGLEWFASATLQSSHARFPVSQSEGSAPNVPDLCGDVGVMADVKGWSLSLDSRYTGSRTQASTDGTAGLPAVAFRNATGVWTLNAVISRPLGEGFLTFSADNFTRSPLYPGFGVSSSYRLSYQQRY